MAINEVSAADAAAILDQDDDALYLDVRTVREFEQGHPTGAFNVPFVFMNPGGPAEANADFCAIVGRHFAKDRKLIIGCQSGVRSMTACRLLSEAGYTDVTNVAGGYGGARDRSGQILAVGWRDAGLPTSSSAEPGRSYDDLSA